MGCCKCSPKCQKWTTLGLAITFLVLGTLLVVLWDSLFQKIANQQMSVANPNTKGFKMWKETPIPMYLDVYLFNWTNPDRVQKYHGVKPEFVQMGPYVFHEHHSRENITFNKNNNTLTYLTKRTWRFEPNMSSGALENKITILNPLPIFIANHIKDEHYLVKRAVNFFLEEKGEALSTTKTIKELLFDGYDDSLIDIAAKLNISGLNLPFKKFGWFVDRNGSATFDGVFNMYNGEGDISKLGLITEWNYQHKTSYYPGECGVVNGTSGELWYPPGEREQVAIFASDLCSNVQLHRSGTATLYGVQGHVYEAGADALDNGTYYKSSKCFASGMPTGVRGVAKCKFNAPAYMSYPHFYLADPIYLRSVVGMNPDAAKHATKMSLEPKTGIPMKVHAAFQLNLLMRQMDGIDMFAKVKTTLMPCFWFVQRAQLSEELASLAKGLIIASKAGIYTGYGFIGLGALLFIAFTVIAYKTGLKSNEEEEPLTET